MHCRFSKQDCTSFAQSSNYRGIALCNSDWAASTTGHPAHMKCVLHDNRYATHWSGEFATCNLAIHGIRRCSCPFLVHMPERTEFCAFVGSDQSLFDDFPGAARPVRDRRGRCADADHCHVIAPASRKRA